MAGEENDHPQPGGWSAHRLADAPDTCGGIPDEEPARAAQHLPDGPFSSGPDQVGALHARLAGETSLYSAIIRSVVGKEEHRLPSSVGCAFRVLPL